MARSPILSMVYTRNKMKQVENVGGRIQNGFGAVRDLGGKIKKRIIPERTKRRIFDEEAIERRNEQLIDRNLIKSEQKRIYEKLLESMGIRGRIDTYLANRDPRIRAMAITIHSIFGANVSLAEIANINKILQNNLHSKAPIVLQSPALQNAIEQIRNRKARIGGQEYEILAQASLDILRNDQVGQQILQKNRIG